MILFFTGVILIAVLVALWYLRTFYERMRYWQASDEREEAGFVPGRTLALENRTLYSAKYGLAGKPDRIVKRDGMPIPEEWKAAGRVYPSHRAQMGVYLLLIEEEYGIRPPYGVIVTQGGQRHLIENDDQLRNWVLGIAEQIRAARRRVASPIQVRQPPTKCRACGVRDYCSQRQG